MNKLILTMIIGLITCFGIQQAEAQQKKSTNPLLGKWVRVSESTIAENPNTIREDVISYTYEQSIYQFLANGKGVILETYDPEEGNFSESTMSWKVVGNKITVLESGEAIFDNYDFIIQGNTMIIKNSVKQAGDNVVNQYKFKRKK